MAGEEQMGECSRMAGGRHAADLPHAERSARLRIAELANEGNVKVESGPGCVLVLASSALPIPVAHGRIYLEAEAQGVRATPKAFGAVSSTIPCMN